MSDMHRNPNVAGDVHFYYGKGEIVGHFPIGALESHKSVIFRMYKSDKVPTATTQTKRASDGRSERTSRIHMEPDTFYCMQVLEESWELKGARVL